MLPSDVALTTDSKFWEIVQEYAQDQGSFFENFQTSFEKLLEINVEKGLGGYVSTDLAATTGQQQVWKLEYLD